MPAGSASAGTTSWWTAPEASVTRSQVSTSAGTSSPSSTSARRCASIASGASATPHTNSRAALTSESASQSMAPNRRYTSRQRPSPPCPMRLAPHRRRGEAHQEPPGSPRIAATRRTAAVAADPRSAPGLRVGGPRLAGQLEREQPAVRLGDHAVQDRLEAGGQPDGGAPLEQRRVVDQLPGDALARDVQLE